MVLHVTLLLLAFVVSRGSCASVSGRIYHGMNATSGQFPYVTRLVIKLPSGAVAFCTGSLITDQWVVSAGHCLTGVKSVDVYLGQSQTPVNQSETVLKYTVPASDITPHPKYNNYNPAAGYDIALLKLPVKVDLTKYPNIKSIAITEEVPVGTYDSYKAISVGWGITSNTNGLAKTLQYANVTIQVHSQCQKNYRALDSHICTLREAPNYSGTCGGDSGGPLVVTGSDGNPLQVGANSLGLGNCERKLGTLYTYVGSYTSWVRQTIG